MKLCDYGCGQEAKYQFKNGKWCCSKNFRSCPSYRNRRSIYMKEFWKNPNSKYNSISFREKQSNIMKEIWEDPTSKLNSISCKENQSKIMKELWKDLNNGLNSNSRSKKISKNMKDLWKDPNSKFNSNLYREKQSKVRKITIEQIKERYLFFSKIEEMRYNPNELKEIQVHCKNHNCENSKEKGGWFTPTGIQLSERIRQLEDKNGWGGIYFYCCQECKDTCPLYYLHGDPLKDNNLPYTQQELYIYNKNVLERENGLCEYCGEPATLVHHICPKKLEPFFALDPDYGVACCEKHHYKYGHQGKCSTGNLARIICSAESQKFLNQKI